MNRVLINVRILGYTVAAHRWQVALIGLSLIARPNLREALKYDPLDDDNAAKLAATIVGYNDVPAFIAEQRIITYRMLDQQRYWKSQR